MLSYALSTGTHLATSYFFLPFDEEEDRDIENYERKTITWVPGSTDSALTSPNHPSDTHHASTTGKKRTACEEVHEAGLCHAETSPFSSGPSSPSSSNASLLSACSSSASLCSMSSVGTSVSSGSTTTTGHDTHEASSQGPFLSHPPTASSSTGSVSKPKPSTSDRNSTNRTPTQPYPHQHPESAASSRAPSPIPSPIHTPTPTPSTTFKGKRPAASNPSTPTTPNAPDDSSIREIIHDNDLYSILGLPSSTAVLDKMTLRRAYLARSRMCHPDKFPSNPDATQAFQKVSIAYDVLSTPTLKRRYDEHRARARARTHSRSSSYSATSPYSPSFPSTSTSSSSSTGFSTAPTTEEGWEYDVFANARPSRSAEDTLRSVILGVFNDFLEDGDFEVMKNLLRAINEMNPGVKIGEEGVKTVLSTLHSIRERALTCRTCIYTLHTEFTRLLEVQHAFSRLSYFDILGRTRMAVQISRIAVGLPMVLEKALMVEREKARVMRMSSSSSSSATKMGRRGPERSGTESGQRGGETYVDADGRVRRKAGNPSTAPVVSGTGEEGGSEGAAQEVEGVFPRHVMLIVRSVDVALERMERILKC